MYKKIKDHPTTREIYSRRLVTEGVVSDGEVDGLIKEFEAFLDAEYEGGSSFKPNKADWLDGVWSGLGLPDDDDRKGQTSVALSKLRDLGLNITKAPEGVDMHKTLVRVVENRRKAIENGRGCGLGACRASGVRHLAR